MAEEQTPKFETIMWRKGNPRTFEEASSCEHLGATMPFGFTPKTRFGSSGLLLRREAPIVQVNVAAPIQPFRLCCKSPDVLAIARAALRAEFPNMEGEVQSFELTGLDLCRLCPFYQAPATQ
jgi:hypothetical protein